VAPEEHAVELEHWRVSPGTFLAAWPDLEDPNFSRSIVILCQHGPRGALGFVINRPTGLTIDRLLPDHPLLSKLGTPIYLGGPVDHTRLQFLHRAPAAIPGGQEIAEGLFLGGELEALAAYLRGQQRPRGVDVDGLRLFLGYSGWGAGQLEAELVHGSWVPAPLDAPLVFSAQGEDDWRRVVASSGAGDAWLGLAPGSGPN
jgi:putative transcriptional regulator